MSDLLVHIGNDSELRNELVESWDVADILFYNQTGSTQNIARALAEAGAPEWTLVIADYQTDGRGQHGKSWIAPPGTSLMFSLLLRPGSPEAMSLLPIRTGIILSRVLDSLFKNAGNDAHTLLKWPNDILVGNSKLAGILAEGSIRNEQFYAILGIGINVYRADLEIGENASYQPIFINDIITQNINRLSILDAAITALRGSLRSDLEDLMPSEVEEFARRDWMRGRRVEEPLQGKAAGINRRGHLLVENDLGNIETIIAGSVALLQ